MSTPAERATNAFKEQIDGPIASYLSSCVHCGMCAHACLFYTETEDPRYTPINKVEPLRRVWKSEYTFFGKLASKFGLTKSVTDELLKEWELLIYDACTLCGRCSMVCPVGNDIAYMIRKTREGMIAAGYAPRGLKDATYRAVTVGSPMGVKLPALKAQIKHVEKDTGLKVPLDVEGADYMALLSSMEIMNFPEYIEALTRLFDKAGVSWTLCSEAFEATNSGMQIGSSDIEGELIQRIVDGAEKLKVKYVISPECGHAYYALRWEGPNVIGKKYPFEVVHILELLDQLRAQGKLKVEGKLDQKLTFHDPCQIVRKGGVVDEPRRLLNMVSSNFVEMEDAGVMNWCCGGGGGVSANERAEPLKLTVFNRKKSQLEKLGVNTMVTACANCRINLEEGIEHTNMDVEVVGLAETLAEHLAD
ncbi:MAG: (Fe-S)-binding protein [Arenicellales bacterium]|nr:(Fe-S)-binding protein [Arenicellales bacterium]